MRDDAEALGATQFEILTAAALPTSPSAASRSPPSRRGSAAASTRRTSSTPRVVLLTNVGLEHTEILGETREAIAREKLAVAHAGSVVVLPDGSSRRSSAAHEVVTSAAPRGGRGLTSATRSTPTSRSLSPAGSSSGGGEIRDGAHTPEAAEWLLERLPEPRDYVVVASILADKDVDGILSVLARAGGSFVATSSSSSRALPTSELADRAREYFADVREAPRPAVALARGRSLGRPVLVTGSLYLLADLSGHD